MKHISLLIFIICLLTGCDKSYNQIKSKCDKLNHDNCINYSNSIDYALVVYRFNDNILIYNDSIIIAPSVYVFEPNNSDTIRIICTNKINKENLSGLLLVKNIDIQFDNKKIYLIKDSLNNIPIKTIFGNVDFLDE